MSTFDYGPECLGRDRMLPVLSVEAMRKADRIAIDDLGIPGFALMETAGRAVSTAVRRIVHAGARVGVFCGGGNNGGDGFVAARLLAQAGYDVTAIATGKPADGTDALSHWKLLKRAASCIDSLHVIEAVPFLASTAPRNFACCLDAMLGTGTERPLHGAIAELVEWMNVVDAPIVAVDIPTGIHGDTGEVLGSAVRADRTVTMAALKTGMLIGDGPEHCGTIEIAEIGIPQDVLVSIATAQKSGFATTDETAAALLPRRARDAYKYNSGVVLVIAGSEGMSGAAVLASRAAARMGAGYVMCATPADVASIVASGIPSSTTIALPNSSGGIDSEAAMSAIGNKLERADAIVIGPGLGRAESTQSFVRSVLDTWDGPTVVDADAIIALASTELRKFPSRHHWVLTPHAGEFEAISGNKPAGLDRLEVARQFAEEFELTLLLKGAPSLVAGKHGIIVATAANESLATSGTGDVLSGMSAALLARGMDPQRAAAVALHIGGRTAEAYAVENEPSSMVAADLIHQLPRVLRQRFSIT
jgi:ADP-dependent NAD(P)H-hydrate dehydratase / NAD(P)H-hydrate epimerase